MPMTADDLQKMISAALPDAMIEIHDLAGDNNHFRVVVTSPAFAGMPRVRQHQMIYDALGGRAGTELHALSIETRAV